MGREVRMVPPNWDHPKVRNQMTGERQDQPMHDRDFGEVFAQWLAEFDRVRSGDMSDLERECYPLGLADWLKDDGRPPDPIYHRPWAKADATWFQLWETVSEGTPVTPPFATAEELIQYLAKNGDFWDQDRCTKSEWTTLWRGVHGVSGWGFDRARRFMEAGLAPSFVLKDGVLHQGTEVFAA